LIIAEYKNKFFNKYKVLRTFQDDNSGLEFPVGYSVAVHVAIAVGLNERGLNVSLGI